MGMTHYNTKANWRGIRRNSPRRSLRSRPEARWCAYCEWRAESWDHVEPLVHGGANTDDNLLPACHQCNNDKADLPLIVFLALTSPGL